MYFSALIFIYIFKLWNFDYVHSVFSPVHWTSFWLLLNSFQVDCLSPLCFFSFWGCVLFVWNIFLCLLTFLYSLCLFFCIKSVRRSSHYLGSGGTLWSPELCALGSSYVGSMYPSTPVGLTTVSVLLDRAGLWPSWLWDCATCSGCELAGGKRRIPVSLAVCPRRT